jgi:hypothetical protein
VPRPTLSEIIDGQLIAEDTEIHPTEDEPVRAIDVLEPYAVVYRFSTDAGGAWFASCTMAQRAGDGSWQDTGSSGTRGEALELPWRPSRRTLNGHTLAIFGSGGMGVGEGTSAFLRFVVGFADPSVRQLRARAATGERTIEVRSPVGAFAVLVLGESAVEMQGLSADGEEVGQPATGNPVDALADRRIRRRSRRTRGWRLGRS